MAYTDSVRLMAAFPDTQPSFGPVPPELIDSAIQQACALIDAYLAGVYALPIPGDVPILTHIANEIAFFYIFTAHAFVAPPRNVDTTWPTRYNNALTLLTSIQSGALGLVMSGGAILLPTSTGVGTAWSTTQHYAPTFSEADDRLSRVDPNKLDAENAKRV